jgi:hypothetical protein
MQVSKSFCNVKAFLSNTPGVNSPVGELSTYGQTFSREVGVYQHNPVSDYTLFNFKNINTAGQAIPMADALVQQSIELCALIVNRTLGVNGQVFGDETLAAITAAFGSAGMSSVFLGNYVNYSGVWMPEYVKFTTAVSDANENTIWFSMAAFAQQYSDYDIVVVPPIDNLDLFFQTYGSVGAVVGALTVPGLFDRADAAKAGNPETLIRADEYNFINPLNTVQTLLTRWAILVYGPAGNNIDAIKDAMVEYILANSSHTRTEWTVRFPDIFKRTEFILLPGWHKYAIPNMQTTAGIYSPLVNAKDANVFTKALVPAYSSAHVDNHLVVMPNLYRSIAIMTIGGIDNRNALYELSQVFADLINVPTSSADFNRMSQPTKDWVSMIADLLVIAETMNEFTDLPHGTSKLIRDGVLYVVKNYMNIQYLIASKSSVIAAYPVV